MLEDPCVSLIPDGPRNKHGEGRLGLAVWRAIVTSTCPPTLSRVEEGPTIGVKPVNVVFVNDQGPKPSCVAAFEEEMRPTFLHSLAKRAEITVGPPAFGQSIGGPNSVLQRQPSEELDFWGGPSLPNHFIQRCENHP